MTERGNNSAKLSDHCSYDRHALPTAESSPFHVVLHPKCRGLLTHVMVCVVVLILYTTLSKHRARNRGGWEEIGKGGCREWDSEEGDKEIQHQRENLKQDNQTDCPASVLWSMDQDSLCILHKLVTQSSFWSECSYLRKDCKPSLGENINMHDISSNSLVNRGL